MAIQRLLTGVKQEDFFINIWDQKPYHFTKKSDLFVNTISVSTVESMLTDGDIRFPLFQMAMQGAGLTKADFTRTRSMGNHRYDDLVNVPAVYKLWNEGASVILNSLQSCYPPIGAIARVLEKEFGHPVQINAYLTPANSQGFDVHYDTHDVFAIQIEGRKRWRIWQDRYEPIPLKHERSTGRSPASDKLIFDVVTEPGEVVYIPRGFFHEAASVEETSLHLTLGLLNYRNLDAVRFVFDQVLSELANGGHGFWRQSVGSASTRSSPQFRAALSGVLEIIEEKWSLDEVERRFFETRRPMNQRIMNQTAAIKNISLTSRFRCETVVSQTSEGSSRFALLYRSRRLSLPSAAQDAINQMIKKEFFELSEIENYTTDSLVGISKHLVKEGFLYLDVD